MRFDVELLRFPVTITVEADSSAEAIKKAKEQVDFAVYEVGEVYAEPDKFFKEVKG